MPLELILNKKITDSAWSATGNFSNTAGQKGSADVLVKVTGKNQLELALDAKVFTSKIMDREVILYTNAKPVKVPQVQKGAHVIFKDVWFKLKK